MTSKFVGKRRTTEASVVLSSVEISVQRLDAAGDASGPEVDLGRLVVNEEGYVTAEHPDGQAQDAPGFKLIVRERGRESRTTVTELRWPSAVPVDPEPDVTPPSAPTDLQAADVTRTSMSLSWTASADDVAVSHYEISVDGQIAANAAGTSMHLANLLDPDVDAFVRVVGVRAVDASGNASSPAWVDTPLPLREVDPGPGMSPWPTPGTVGFLGDASALQPMRAGAIRTAGTVIENRRIDCSDGELGIHADDVVIRNCIIDCGVWGVFLYNGADNLVIEDCTFIGGYQAGIGLSQAKNWRVSRCDFHSGRDAIKPGGSGVIEDCYMHDPDTGGDAHNDCMQFSDCDGVVVRRNRMEGADTSCLAMFEDQGTFRNVKITDNYLGGAGYAIYAGGNDGTNIAIVYNTFGPYGYQHPVTSWESKAGNIFTGNVFTNGDPVPVP